MSDHDVPRTVEEVVPARKSRFRPWMVFVLIAGVLLPAAAITVELFTGICAIMVDPIPTGWHILLWSLIPVTNLLTLLAYWKGSARIPGVLAFLIGASIGVAIAYSIQFLPLAPFSLIGVLLMGVGLCGLSPFFALASSVVCSRRFRDLQLVDEHRRLCLLYCGAATSMAIVVVYAATVFFTNCGIELASSSYEPESRRGVRMVRTLGSDGLLLRACYDLPIEMFPDVSIWGTQVDPNRIEQARETYYKVTGRTFNSVPPPRLLGARSAWISEVDRDSDVGGSAVNSVRSDISMASSGMEANIDPDALTSYTEWTLTFKNKASVDREARAEIALPPGGVVSRLTLWVNGEPREAAWSTRGKVTEAYRQVAVVQQRDPVLVTSCGPDRVLMQCFPIPRDGGTMKVRLGVTSPLSVVSDGEALFYLPRFIERNFAAPRGVNHSISIRSPRAVIVPGDIHNIPDPGAPLRHTMSDEELCNVSNRFVCERDSGVKAVWSPDRTDPRYAVVQSLDDDVVYRPRRAIIVIDNQRAMKSYRREIADALAALPAEMEFSIIAAGDEAVHLASPQPAGQEAIKDAQRKILRLPFTGGADSRPALIKAWDERVMMSHGSGLPGSFVVWVHGPQPLRSETYAEQLRQCTVGMGNDKILCLAAADGRNTVLADMEQTSTITVLARRDSVGSDLRRLFSSWSGQSTQKTANRQRVPIDAVRDAVETSSHLTRLWAHDEVKRICSTGDSRRFTEASELAAKYQLVTPVSGAVVLETEEQYTAAGLEPADPATVPSTVPEPAGLVGLAMGGLYWAAMYRRRRSKTPHTRQASS